MHLRGGIKMVKRKKTTRKKRGKKTTKRLTANERRIYKEMIATFGGKKYVDVAKIRARVLAYRKRKTNRTTAKDLEDMFGY